MLAWIAENSVTVIALAVIATVCGLAVFSLVRDKKKKTGGCTGSCASCGMCCPRGENTNEKRGS